MGKDAQRADLVQERQDLTTARPAVKARQDAATDPAKAKVLADEVARIDRRLNEINGELS